MLLRSQLARSSTFRSGHQPRRHDFHQAFRSDTFYTLNGSLHTGSSGRTSTSKLNLEYSTFSGILALCSAIPTTAAYSENFWQLWVIRIRVLFALSLFLVLALVAILVLNVFPVRSRLFPTRFHISSRHFQAWLEILHVRAMLNRANCCQYSDRSVVGSVRFDFQSTAALYCHVATTDASPQRRRP
jgi:hypothetical protein